MHVVTFLDYLISSMFIKFLGLLYLCWGFRFTTEYHDKAAELLLFQWFGLWSHAVHDINFVLKTKHLTHIELDMHIVVCLFFARANSQASALALWSYRYFLYNFHVDIAYSLAPCRSVEQNLIEIESELH